jgi:KDO2-lipid IV(A) lauroyltransferase
MPVTTHLPSAAIAGYRLLAAFVVILPWPARELLADVSGAITFCIAPLTRRALHGNLSVILGPAVPSWRVSLAVLRTYQNFARYMIELVTYPTSVPGLIAGCRIRGWPGFHAAATGRGVVAVSAHFASSIAASAFGPLRGLPTWCVMSQAHVELLARVFPGRGRLRRQRLVALQGAMRRCAAVLATPPGVVAIMGDLALGERGVTVQLCGRTACLPQGPARLALRTNAVLMPGFVIRLPGGRLRFELGPAIEPPDGLPPAAQAQAMTQAYARHLGEVLRRHPDQWFMFRDAFQAA